jgi:hypothetical protein
MTRSLPIFLTIVFLIFLALPVEAQSPTQKATQWLEADAKKADAPKPVELPPSQPPAKPPAEMGSLSIEAGIVYQFGGAQPVARNDFVLFDQNPETILSDALMLQLKYRGPNYSKALEPDSFLVNYVLCSFSIKQEEINAVNAANRVLRGHVAAGGTTDFGGKLTFSAVPTGTYWLFGITRLRSGFTFWNLRVAIGPGSQGVILDQRNAAF